MLKTIKFFLFSLMAGLFLMTTACQSGPAAGSGADTSVAALPVSSGPYILGGGDSVRITVFGEDDLSGEYELDGAGVLSMPLIGRVEALGLTPTQLEQSITTNLAGDFLRDPKVSVEVTSYRPYYILGEVNTPGEYQYSNGLTVLNAVAGAGGFTYRAKQNKVYVRRADSEQEVEVDLTPTTKVSPGDTLRFKERIF